jgi:phenylacetate-CoA ligase
LTFADGRYVRMHRTSGSKGEPFYVFDTQIDWQWWIDSWQYVLDAAQVVPGDRALMAFSFGPFIGFWSAAESLSHRGAMIIPAGGLPTGARLDMLWECRATVVCATPTYALHMAHTARELGQDLRQSQVRVLIVAGEPGGSLPEVRQRLQSEWGAGVIDHAGASEVGPWGYGTLDGGGLYVNEAEFIAEFLPGNVPDGTENVSELVLTALGRPGWPVIRYRTGDLVLPGPAPAASSRHVFLRGGVLGRADDMIVIRGVNIFPGSIENVLRQFADVVEFRITATRHDALDEISVEVESSLTEPGQIAAALLQKLGLRVNVERVPGGSLPRSEAKSRRFVDLRQV